MSGIRVTIRLTDDASGRAPRTRQPCRSNQSTTLRELIRRAGAGEGLWPPPPPTERELLALIEERARRWKRHSGHVPPSVAREAPADPGG